VRPDLRGRTALVTGASSGIGAASARALAAAGATVVLTGTDPERLAATAACTGGRTVVADLTDPDGLERVCQAATRAEVLVHSAGRGWAGEFATMPDADISTLVELNVTVPLRLTRAALPHMRERGRGHLAFVASVAVVGVGREAAYSATKAGLRAFAAGLRHELAGDGIGVTTVFPGAVDTPFFANRGRGYERRFPRMVAPEAVAGALVRAIERNRPEVFVPGWLTVAARVQGAAPGIFHRMAGRFG
jgi:uncharacterized protein